MPLTRRNSRVFHRNLYRGQMETVTLLKRGDDQNEGAVQQFIIFGARRGNINKSGEAIAFDQGAITAIQWILPCTELRRVGVNYLNVLDRIVDAYNMWWEPESGQNIILSQFDNLYVIDMLRIDPYPNYVLLGNPGVNIPGTNITEITT